MKKRFPLFVLVAPLLVACGNPAPSSSHATGLSSSQTPSSNSQSSSSASSSSTPGYTDKEVNVFYVKSELNFKTKLRFYDTTGDIPYIPIDDYYSLLLKGRSTDPNRSKLTVTANGDTYSVTSPGGSATFNVATETMTTDNLPFFVSTKTYASGYNALLGTDGMPWMKVGEVKASGDPQKTVIDFSKYHIDLKGEGNRLYLPLITAQDLFS
ncbi:MAG: hypothetical protein II721_07090, partial [Bacilli bacterium]|nr:hypothetical protein [Bacilli bacterium]